MSGAAPPPNDAHMASAADSAAADVPSAPVATAASVIARLQEYAASVGVDGASALEATDDARLEIIRKAIKQADEVLKKEEGLGVEQLGSLYVRASTNGELLEPGVDELLALLRPGADAVFADLGSGAGCALLHVAARVSMRACVGVELVGARHEAALAALDMICSERDNALKTPTTFLKADLCELERFIQVPLADEVHLGDLTHVYLSSVCFDDYLLRTIARTLGSPELCPNIQAAVSLRELPSNPYLTEIGKLPLTCSWNARCIARVYVPTDLLSRRKQPIAVLARFCCAGDKQTGFVCTLPYALQYPQHGRLRLPRQ